jgi:hypothetical protein
MIGGEPKSTRVVLLSLNNLTLSSLIPLLLPTVAALFPFHTIVALIILAWATIILEAGLEAGVAGHGGGGRAAEVELRQLGSREVVLVEGEVRGETGRVVLFL